MREKEKGIVEVRKDCLPNHTSPFSCMEASPKGFKDLWAGVQFAVHNLACSHVRLVTLPRTADLPSGNCSDE